MRNKFLILSTFLIFISCNLISAMVVSSVAIDKLYPGQTASLNIDLKNTLSEDVEDVSLALNLEGTQFTTIGSSEDSEEEISEDDKETFNFVLKASSDMKPGDYNIPYTITYTNSNSTQKTKTGSFGITLSAKTELNYVLEEKNNVVGETGKLSIKMINSGLADIKFVSVKIASNNGFEILSNTEEYIGTISSNDFETASFDVVYQKTNADLSAIVKYKDFENNEKTETISFPVEAYSREKALELGLIQKSKTWLYATIAGIILIWIIYKKIKKNKKQNGKSS